MALGIRNGPVFIIGPPRSGTTLFYQCYVQSFQPAYISNLAVAWSRRPTLASLLTRLARRWHKSDTDSNYGRTSPWYSPHEGWPIWNQWFRNGSDGDYASKSALSREHVLAMNEFVGKMQAIYGEHFVSKNVKHSVRIQALNAAFPNCLFVVVHRRQLPNAKSLFAGWQKFAPEAAQWWSVRPSDFREYEQAPNHQRACRQLVGVQKDVERDAHIVGRKRFLDVQYEEFCADPQSTMEAVKKFLAAGGIEVRKMRPLPARFTASDGPSLALRDEEQLTLALSEAFEQLTLQPR